MEVPHLLLLLLFFLRFYLSLEREEGREKEERNIDISEKHWLVASRTPPAGDLARNPGLCPDWESNQQPFSLRAGAQSPEPPQPGHRAFFNTPPSPVTDTSISPSLPTETVQSLVLMLIGRYGQDACTLLLLLIFSISFYFTFLMCNYLLLFFVLLLIC